MLEKERKTKKCWEMPGACQTPHPPAAPEALLASHSLGGGSVHVSAKAYGARRGKRTLPPTLEGAVSEVGRHQNSAPSPFSKHNLRLETVPSVSASVNSPNGIAQRTSRSEYETACFGDNAPPTRAYRWLFSPVATFWLNSADLFLEIGRAHV